MSESKGPLRGLIWFHRDLRLQDQEAVEEALRTGERIEAFFVPAAGNGDLPQTRFLRECQEELRAGLEALGIPVHRIPGEQLAPWLDRAAREYPQAHLLRGRCYNSRDEKWIREGSRSWESGRVRVYDSGTLHREEDLPFSLQELPDTFTPFHRRLQKDQVPIRPPVGPGIPNPEPFAAGDRFRARPARGFSFAGGEAAAHARLTEYFENSRAVRNYRETRNGMLEWNDSSKLSPYLAAGCLTARQVHAALVRHEAEHGANESTEALRYELVWRDYFKFLSLRYGEKIFSEEGIRGRKIDSVPDRELFLRWTRGETGQEFVDANLRELAETGWMSNRGRQNVASFFAKTLRLPWVWGAEWFASRLVDYDPETNWGNWMYLAGVGTDPRDRVFDPDRQAGMYDPEGRYRSLWSSGK